MMEKTLFRLCHYLHPYYNVGSFRRLIELKYFKTGLEKFYFKFTYDIIYIFLLLRTVIFLTRTDLVNTKYLSIGPFSHSKATATYVIFFAFTEILYTQTWFTNLKKSRADLLSDLLDLDDYFDKEKRSLTTKFLDRLIVSLSMVNHVIVVLYFIDYYVIADIYGKLITIWWCILLTLIARHVISDIFVLYFYLYLVTVTASKMNLEELNLILEFDESNKTKKVIKLYQLIGRHKKIIKLLKRVNPLSSVIQLTARVLIIPMFASKG